MNDASTSERLQPAQDMRTARAVFAREIGTERLARLHAPSRVLDHLSIFGSIALFVLLAWQLATGGAGSVGWWLCLLAQGSLIVAMSIVNHDVFVHRKLLPTPLRWVLSQVLTWPAQLRGSVFESRHLTHHRELATENDPEFYSRGLDTAMRRICYATPLMLVFRQVIYREQDASAKDRPAHGGEVRLRWEKCTRLALWAIALGSLVFDWRLLVVGYLLPLAFVTPLVNTLRIVLEHFDLGRGNPMWPGTFYRIPQALRLMRPIIVREGVHEHRSLPALLADWFSGARAHWTRPAGATSKCEAAQAA
jgi:fatty acid desaturase